MHSRVPLLRTRIAITPLREKSVGARGIDAEGLSFVIHHQLPEQIEYFTHRSGRAARAE